MCEVEPIHYHLEERKPRKYNGDVRSMPDEVAKHQKEARGIDPLDLIDPNDKDGEEEEDTQENPNDGKVTALLRRNY